MEQNQQRQLDRYSEVRFLKGVGPRRAEHFEQLGVHSVGDLLEYYPRGYEFLPEFCLIGEMMENQTVAVAGEVWEFRLNRRSRPARLDMVLRDSSGSCRLVWFHGGYLKDKFLPGDKLAAWGKVSRYKETFQLVNPRWTKVESLEELERRQEQGEPVYPASGKLSSGEIARVVRDSLEMMLETVEDRYSEEFRRERKLPRRVEALRWIHQPTDEDYLGQARRALAYDELFLMELGIGLRKERLQRLQNAYPLEITEKLDKRIKRLFPFLLTADQEKVIGEICVDMARPRPMNRLLQGDVGSGKTVVALYAALLAVGYHRQVAIMAPTEILAEQHFISLERYLRNSKVRRELLTGGLTGKRRVELMGRIAAGEVDIVVGTQALLQKDVQFAKLALVVVDEQHKFGVRQREGIRGKDLAPHYLVMTATPIPRTLAMTVFGDLEVSTIKQLPPGRRKIVTRCYEPDKLPQAYEFIREKVNQGEQVYFVYPRVEEASEQKAAEDDSGQATEESASDKSNGRAIKNEANGKNEKDGKNEADGENSREPENGYTGEQLKTAAEQEFLQQNGYAGGQLKAAVAEQEFLQREIFPDFVVGLLHGQMPQEQKQRVMEDFRKRKIDILVSTVVIEVGVDVPGATIMVIEHADRFGLAQLHQLRGRIGRGSKQSYCLLFGQATTEVAQRRLEVMTKTTDGFVIAEEDLRLRGPGEFFGTAQHGLPELKIANLLEDTDLLRMARRDAFALAKSDPRMARPGNQVLRRELLEKFGEDLKLVDVS
ncbi:MAG: ATP-dependent DNA helicase RecG [Sedimentisphaerales bacterium]|nr:ATP-dependent DNA helicase RecG [Sedimentisphaerales bacterium]